MKIVLCSWVKMTTEINICHLKQQTEKNLALIQMLEFLCFFVFFFTVRYIALNGETRL